RTAGVLDAFGEWCVEHRRRGAANARWYVRWGGDRIERCRCRRRQELRREGDAPGDTLAARPERRRSRAARQSAATARTRREASDEQQRDVERRARDRLGT